MRRCCSGSSPRLPPAWRTRAASPTSKLDSSSIPSPASPAAAATRSSSGARWLELTAPGARSPSCSSGSATARRRRPTGGNATSVDQVAQLLTRVTRRSDISCRRGDREFAILLPETRAVGRNRSHDATSRRGQARTRPEPVDHRSRTCRVAARRVGRGARGACGGGVGTGASDWILDGARIGYRATRAQSRVTHAAASRLDAEPAEALRRDVLDTLGREVASARGRGGRWP